ncbi:DUF1566 domain-containing protein [Alphaproteobacteria bacterium]|jgi:hypothetical protein|nr:DUF1566 domain-containing protein [Alphaproteobacteria bacterium]
MHILHKLKIILGLTGILLCSFLITPSFAKNSQFITKDHIVIDLASGVEWLRCSVGQRWNGSNCTGEIIKLNQELVEQAIEQANQQLGRNWRLPTRKELEGIVCHSCSPPKIDSTIFPDTPAEPFWTGEQNQHSPRHVWSVNFFTGHTYGRFMPFQDLVIRLVRDR